MLRKLAALLLLLVPLAVLADHNAAPRGKVWVQVSSHPGLDEAVAEARRHARNFEFTRVFVNERGDYVVALGVVVLEDAERVIADLVRQRRIPRGSIATEGRDYLTELWFAKRAEDGGSGFIPEMDAALALESRMTAEDRIEIQEALVWTGDYGGGLDGVLGPQTRNAIRAFQLRENILATGWLTRGDRVTLFERRDARREATGWRYVQDGPLGIRLGLPLAWFGDVTGTELGKQLAGRGPARGAVLSLVALEGGRGSLDSLFEAARAEVRRDRNRTEIRTDRGFTLIGRSDGRVLYSHAILAGNEVKGFILTHDEGQDDLLRPVAAAMRASFLTRPVAARPLLEEEIGRSPSPPRTDPPPRTEPAPRRDPPARTDPPSSREQVASGIAGERRPAPRPGRRDPDEPAAPDPAPRRPPERTTPPRPEPERDRRDVDSTGTGFYVSLDGKILTNHHVVDGCRRVVVDGKDDARVLATDRTNDLALLDHRRTRGEDGLARFAPAEPRLNSDVTVVGYPLYGLLGGLNVTRGVVSSLRGLRGDQTFIQISAEVQPGNSGGPALDDRGYVIGVVQSKLDALRLSRISGDIPQNINFAVRGEIAKTFLRSQGVEPLIGPERAALPPADLADEATKFTVLLECIK